MPTHYDSDALDAMSRLREMTTFDLYERVHALTGELNGSDVLDGTFFRREAELAACFMELSARITIGYGYVFEDSIGDEITSSVFAAARGRGADFGAPLVTGAGETENDGRESSHEDLVPPLAGSPTVSDAADEEGEETEDVESSSDQEFDLSYDDTEDDDASPILESDATLPEIETEDCDEPVEDVETDIDHEEIHPERLKTLDEMVLASMRREDDRDAHAWTMTDEPNDQVAAALSAGLDQDAVFVYEDEAEEGEDDENHTAEASFTHNLTADEVLPSHRPASGRTDFADRLREFAASQHDEERSRHLLDSSSPETDDEEEEILASEPNTTCAEEPLVDFDVEDDNADGPTGQEAMIRTDAFFEPADARAIDVTSLSRDERFDGLSEDSTEEELRQWSKSIDRFASLKQEEIELYGDPGKDSASSRSSLGNALLGKVLLIRRDSRQIRKFGNKTRMNPVPRVAGKKRRKSER